MKPPAIPKGWMLLAPTDVLRSSDQIDVAGVWTPCTIPGMTVMYARAIRRARRAGGKGKTE